MLSTSHVMQQAAMKCQILYFDWKIAIGMQLAIAFLFQKTSVFELANNCSNIFAKVLLGMFGVV